MNTSTEMPTGMCNYTAGTLEKSILPAIYALLSFAGILANCWMLWIFGKQFARKSGVRVYLLNISVADLIICLVLPFRMALLIMGDTWDESSDECLAVTTILNLCFYIALASRTLCLIFIGFSRYAVIVKFHNKKFNMLHRFTFAKCACVAFWIVGALVVLTCSIYTLKTMRVSKSRCYSVQVYNRLQPNLMALVVTSMLILIVLTLLFFLYNLVVFYLFQVSKTSTVKHSRKLYKKTLLRICVALTTCAICLLPYIIYQLFSTVYRLTQNECPLLVKMQTAKLVLLCLVSCNSCIDPILYFAFTKYFPVVTWSPDPQTMGKSFDRETASNTH